MLDIIIILSNDAEEHFLLPNVEDIGLAKKFVRVCHTILLKTPNELFGQHNT